MGAQVIDYRVSMLVVLCKDCGEDVGLYPARHKCNQVIRPSLPPLPMSMSNQDNPSTLSTRPPANDRKWSFRSSTSEKKEEEESNYLDQFTATANLPESDPSSSAGKRLWGKLRQNEKWNQLNEKHNAAEKPSGKLWKRLIEATQNMSVREDSGPETP
ncbi:hypothetical protein DFQ29_009463 [Apophysomyces sp. BC1021]|nr:hypothetical protein DFQ29_009463 [Apophysomyces sp. BC1021]